MDAKSLEIIELLEAQGQGVIGFSVRDGLIFYKSYIYMPNLRREIFDHFHISKERGHSGWLRIYIRLKYFFFYWEGIKSEVKKVVVECDVCQKVK